MQCNEDLTSWANEVNINIIRSALLAVNFIWSVWIAKIITNGNEPLLPTKNFSRSSTDVGRKKQLPHIIQDGIGILNAFLEDSNAYSFMMSPET